MVQELTSLTLPDFGKNPLEFLREVRVELKLVIWPTKQAVARMTVLIVIVSVLVGAFVGGLDYAFTRLFQLAVQ
jgi:preprotein translocase subunit SecE